MGIVRGGGGGIIQGAIILGGNCPGGIIQGAIILGGNCPGGGGGLSRGQLVGGNYPGGNYPGGNCPRTLNMSKATQN